MTPNNEGPSDIVTHKTNSLNKELCYAKWRFDDTSVYYGKVFSRLIQCFRVKAIESFG